MIKETRNVFADASDRGTPDQSQRDHQTSRDPRRGSSASSRYGRSTARISQQLIANAAQQPDTVGERLEALYNLQFKTFQAALEKFIATRLDEATVGRQQAQDVSTRVYWILIAVIAVVALVNIILVVALSASLQSKLKGIFGKLEALRRGDLTEETCRRPAPTNWRRSQPASMRFSTRCKVSCATS